MWTCLSATSTAATATTLVWLLLYFPSHLLGLPGSLVASSLGKLIRQEVRDAAQEQDMLSALLNTVTYNIVWFRPSLVLMTPGLACLAQCPNPQCEECCVCGELPPRQQTLKSVLDIDDVALTHTVKTLAYALDFWSSGATQAQFLRHEGYCGSIGALIRGATGNIESLQHMLSRSD